MENIFGTMKIGGTTNFYDDVYKTVVSLIQTASDPKFEAAVWRKMSQTTFSMDMVRYYSVYFGIALDPATPITVALVDNADTFVSLINTDACYEDADKKEEMEDFPLVAAIETSRGVVIAIDYHKMKANDRSVSMFMALYITFTILTQNRINKAYCGTYKSVLFKHYVYDKEEHNGTIMRDQAIYGICEYLNPTSILLAFYTMNFFGITDIDLEKIAKNELFNFLNLEEDKYIPKVEEDPNSENITIMMAILYNLKSAAVVAEYDILDMIYSMLAYKVCEDTLKDYIEYRSITNSINLSSTIFDLYNYMPMV